MDTEIYSTIPNHTNYAISNFGNILNIKKQRFLKHRINNESYKSVVLNKSSKKVHRLLAEAFIDNPENKPFIDHIDNDRTNNVLSNLRWVTSQENNQNRKLSNINTTGFKGVYFSKQKNKWVAQITYANKKYYLGAYNSVDEAKTARQSLANILFKEYTNEFEKAEVNSDLREIIKNKKVLAELNLM